MGPYIADRQLLRFEHPALNHAYLVTIASGGQYDHDLLSLAGKAPVLGEGHRTSPNVADNEFVGLEFVDDVALAVRDVLADVEALCGSHGRLNDAQHLKVGDVLGERVAIATASAFMVTTKSKPSDVAQKLRLGDKRSDTAA